MDAPSDSPFQSLDFVYTPSADVERDLGYFESVLGGRVRFAIEGMGAKVAAVELAPGGPLILLTDHLRGERPILVHRVSSLREAMATLEARGGTPEHTLEIPHGPCCSFTTPGGHRVALYELTRPGVAEHFDGRRDF